MTPAQMFSNYGSDERCKYQKGDAVKTPAGLAKVEYEFTRGMQWWTKTTLGTFRSKTINELNISA